MVNKSCVIYAAGNITETNVTKEVPAGMNIGAHTVGHPTISFSAVQSVLRNKRTKHRTRVTRALVEIPRKTSNNSMFFFVF